MSHHAREMIRWLNICAVSVPLLAMPWSATAATQHKTTRQKNTILFHIMNVPGQADFECASATSNNSSEKCIGTPMKVQVFALPTVHGDIKSCVTFLPYNKLTLHTSSTGEAVTVTYFVDVQGATFVDPGIAIKEDYGYKAKDLFGPPQFSADKKTVTLTTIDGVKKYKKYGHLPMVSLDTGSGTPLTCLGEDPIISNSAD